MKLEKLVEPPKKTVKMLAALLELLCKGICKNQRHILL